MKNICRMVLVLMVGAVCGSAQGVTVNPASLKFDTTLASVTDSLPVWIRNSTSMPVKVTDINIFGNEFSVRDTAFTLNPKDSVRTWIRFSSAHNLTFNDQAFIETDLSSGTVVVPLTGTKKYPEALYASTQGKSAEALKTALGTIAATGQMTLGYTIARDKMYGNIDNVAGEVECIYTGRKATFNTRAGATANNFNCEHTWPQSKFNQSDPMVSDINHLFSTDETANGKRSNYPFGVVVSASWTVGGSKYGTGYGGQIVFEPRDEHKGDCARAMFYFITRYPSNYGGFWGESPYQEAAFRDWNKRFPPTTKSRNRNNGVQQYQGNRNPFIDHPEFIDRINSFTGTATVVTAPRLAVSPETVCHANVAPGGERGWYETFANVGTAPLTVTSAVFSNPAYSFVESLATISPNSYMKIGIRYQPVSATADSVSTLTLTYNDGTSAQQVVVTITASRVPTSAAAVNNAVPVQFILGQNFPNPFNPSTTIRYSVPQSAGKQFVSIRIFDVLGKEVAIAVNEAKEPGEYSALVTLEQMNSGIYFYRMHLQGQTVTKRMLLLK
jgi:hypothetical protein